MILGDVFLLIENLKDTLLKVPPNSNDEHGIKALWSSTMLCNDFKVLKFFYGLLGCNAPSKLSMDMDTSTETSLIKEFLTKASF